MGFIPIGTCNAMIHYHVWFNLKPGVPVQSGLKTVSDFLSELAGAGEASTFQLLKNTGAPPNRNSPPTTPWWNSPTSGPP